MGSNRFARGVALRVAELFALLAAVAWLLEHTDVVVITALLGAAALLQAFLLVRYVGRANRELGRFLGAIRYDDFQQTFAIGELGGSFTDLGGAFRDVLDRFRATRLANEAERRTLEALVEHVPVAILTVRESGAVELLNNAARRLLNAAAGMTLDRLVDYGAAFQRDVAQCKAGDRTLTRIEIDGVPRHLVLSATQLIVTGAPLRLITLQDIQAELDWNELSAWQDMARVLSHEIMNSLTPIASLARTADELVDDLAARAPAPLDQDELCADLHDATRTLARRSEGLMRFVSSYRELTHVPPPAPAPVALADLFRRLVRLLHDDWTRRGITLHVGAPPEGLALVADEALLDQALINLLRNAADAASGQPTPEVWIDARISDRGRPVIEIGDNGPGVDAALGEKIYLPFFTTKPDGSGIGLALARQVMLVHRGAITAGERPGGGALFRLTF